jgi:hypothetical protein
MHLLRLFLTAWLVLGIATVFFLFWLCKRTAQAINRLGKPVLNQDTFQQLLAAAYTLQERKETEAGASRPVSLPLESTLIAQSGVKPLASLNDLADPSLRHRRRLRSDQFFWKVATVTGMAAVFGLLLVGSIDRLSPLPAGLAVQQQEPLPRAVTIVMEPIRTKNGPKRRSADADKSGRSASVRTRRTIAKSIHHSIYESEADMVAPDTVKRYGRRATAQ